jgi:hypothetical protein
MATRRRTWTIGVLIFVILPAAALGDSVAFREDEFEGTAFLMLSAPLEWPMEFDDGTEETFLVNAGAQVKVDGKSIRPSKRTVAIAFARVVIDEPRWSECDNVAILAGKKWVKPLNVSHEMSSGEDGTQREMASVMVSLASFEAMARAKIVKVRVCRIDEVEISGEEMAVIRELARRIRRWPKR